MAKLRFLLLALLIAGVAKIENAETDVEVVAKANPDEANFFKFLPDIGPRIPLEDLIHLFLIARDTMNPESNGFLPTPKDGCGISKVGAPRIVGGRPAKPGQYPWMALVGYLRDPITAFFLGQEISFNCGGSLITSRHVLTAAHCINPLVYMVRLGEHDYASTSNKWAINVRVHHFASHAEYNKHLMINDIAVIHLNADVDFNDRIRPICLPIDDVMRHKSFLRTNPFVAGWGTTSENGHASSVLRHVQIPVITNDQCMVANLVNGMFKSPIQFDDYVICAGFLTGGKDSCQGDSGGPLMLPQPQNGKFPFYQIGVVSYGNGCARAVAPGIYTRVQHYADWIIHNTKY